MSTDMEYSVKAAGGFGPTKRTREVEQIKRYTWTANGMMEHPDGEYLAYFEIPSVCGKTTIRYNPDELVAALEACDKAFVNWQLGQIPGRPEDILALISQVRAAIAQAK